MTNYTTLLASIASWLNRSDQTANIPDFLTLAESAIADDVRLQGMIVRSTLSTVAAQDYITLPADWLEFVYVKVDGLPLEYMPADRLRAASLQTGALKNYSIEGGRLLLTPTPDGIVSVDISYFAKLPALSGTATNFLLTRWPQIYLYKSLANGFRFLMDGPHADYWDAQYAAEVAKAQSADKAGLSSGSPLRIRTR